MIRLVGLYREKEYSPGRHRSNDARLLEDVAARLRARAFLVDLLTIDQAAGCAPGPSGYRPGALDPAELSGCRPGPLDAACELILSMCQGRAALDLLAAWERDGAQIVNSPRAALNTYRDRLPDLMRGAGVRYPPTELVPTSGPVAWSSGAWLKRGDVHASVSADVQWVDSQAALDAGRADFASRGIAAAALQAHRAGDEIKFYGVRRASVDDTGFFHWFYSGPARPYAFDASRLPRLAERAAAAAGLEIFGGDVIVSPSGALTLIDLNDWPSFAPCRAPAADAIADYLTRRVHAAWNRGLVSSANQSAV